MPRASRQRCRPARSPRRRRAAAERGLAQASRYSWEACAEAALHAYASAMEVACASPLMRANCAAVPPASAATSPACSTPGPTTPRRRRHQWTLYAHARPEVPDRWEERVRVIERWRRHRLGTDRRCRARWSRERPDVLFAPGYTAPLTVAAPMVLTVHDVSFFAHPEWFSFREGTRRRMLTAWSARRARRVITDSQFSKSEISRHIGIDAVAGQGHSAWHRSNGHAGAGSRTRTAANRSCCYVGSIFARRRVDRLIEAFDLVAERVPDARLEIVGENRTRRPRLDLEALRPTAVVMPIASSSARTSTTTTLTTLYTAGHRCWRSCPSTKASASRRSRRSPPAWRRSCSTRRSRARPVARRRATCHRRRHGADVADAIAELLTDAAARRELLQRADTVLARYDWDLRRGRHAQGPRGGCRLAVRDSLAIIIVTYNSREEIDACLESLVGHTAPFPTTITVVDNQSTDGTAGHVRRALAARCSVIDAGGNLGFARANNIGIRATESEYVLLMNPDTVAPPGAIQTLVRGLASHPEAAIAGARLLGTTGFPGALVGPHDRAVE